MKFGVYCVRDKVAEICSPPNFAVNHGVASRQFVNLMKNVEPHDRDAYQLWFLGSWDDSNGKFELNDQVEVIDVAIPRFDDIKQRNFGFEEGQS